MSSSNGRSFCLHCSQPYVSFEQHQQICQKQKQKSQMSKQEQIKCPNCDIVHNQYEKPSHKCRQKQEQVSCSRCGETYLKNSKSHQCRKQIAPSQIPITMKCKYCLQEFLSQELTNHQVRCNKNQYEQCQNCRNLIQKSQFQSHQSYCKQKQEQKAPSVVKESVKCDYCNEDYPIMYLEEHLQLCQAKLVVDQANIEALEEQKDQSNSRINNRNNHNQYVNGRHNRQNSNNNRNRVLQSERQEILMPDGSVEIRLSTNHPNNSDIFEEMNINENRNSSSIYNPFMLLNQMNLRGDPFSQINQRNQRRDPFAHFNNIFNSPFFNSSFSNQMGLNQPRLIRIPFTGGEQDLQFLQFLQQGHEPEQGLEDTELNHINTAQYKPSQNLSEENKKCVICMTDYVEKDDLKILPCTHRFHVQCIDQWLKDHSKCPICKKDVRQA